MYRWAEIGPTIVPKPMPEREQGKPLERDAREDARGARGSAVETVPRRAPRTFTATEKRNVSTRMRQWVREFYEGRCCPRAFRGTRNVVAGNAPGDVSQRATVMTARWLVPEASARRRPPEGEALGALPS